MTSFTGTVNLSTTAGTITPATSANFTAGVLTQSVTVTQVGVNRTISAIDNVSGKVGISNTFTVNPGPLDHFAISTITSPQVAGTAITGITLTAQDVNNNTVTSFASTVTYSGTAGITGTSAAFTCWRVDVVSV